MWTYSEFLHDAERLARALSTRHAQGARVALYASNSPEWMVFEYACGLAGVTLAMANPAYQVRELAYVVEQSGAEAIYYVSEFRGNLMAQIVAEVADQIPAVQLLRSSTPPAPPTSRRVPSSTTRESSRMPTAG